MSMKLLVVIVDGATLDYILQIPGDKIPTITTLIQSGVHGRLRSIMPPISCPAWVSLRTGVNPGKLGFYNFYRKLPGEYKIEPVNYKVPIPAFWDILSDRGIKVAILNAHLTHPANPVNGVMVAAVYKDSGEYCYPEAFKKIIEDKFGRIEFEIRNRREFLKNPLEYHFKLESNRLNLCHLALDFEEYDLAVAGFNIDRILHFVTDQAGILKVHQKLDEILNSLIKKASPENIIIASDHGFGSMKGIFNINTWLYKNGFLRWKKPALVFLKRVFNELDRRYFSKTPTFGDFMDYIDWNRTRAFSPVDSGIYINLEGREPLGIVKPADYEDTREAIINKLKATLSDLIHIYRREEVYTGTYLEEMPDIVFWIDEYENNCGIRRKILSNPMKTGHLGAHRIDGLFIATGKDIKTIKEQQAFNLLDIAPTVLHFFGSPIPIEYDGKVLPIFSEKSEVSKRKPTYTSFEKEGKFPGVCQQKTDSEEMAKRLRALGYIE